MQLLLQVFPSCSRSKLRSKVFSVYERVKAFQRFIEIDWFHEGDVLKFTKKAFPNGISPIPLEALRMPEEGL